MPASFEPSRGRVERRVRQVLLPLLAAIDSVAQRLVRPDPRRICYASIPDYTDNSLAVYKHLLATRRDLEHIWFIRDMSVADRVRREFASAEERGHRLVIRRWGGMWAYPSFLRAKYLFHTHGVFGFSQAKAGRISVCLWHGMPVKAIRRLHKGDVDIFPVHGTLHLATSSFFRYVIAGVFDVHPDSVLVSGLPRTDVLKGFATPTYDRDRISRELGFDPDKRWLLWMPTHRSEPDHAGTRPVRTFLEATDPSMIDALDAACGQHGVQVIVKLHPFDLLNNDPVDLEQPNLTLLTAPQWEATGIPLYDLVAAADALVTDLSSIFIDYLHTGRPIGIMDYDASRYTRDTLFDPALLLRCWAAHALTAPDDVKDFVAAMSNCPLQPSEIHDLSVVFNEDHEIASAERVVGTVGL